MRTRSDCTQKLLPALRFLRPSDLLSVALVSRDWRLISKCLDLWRPFLEGDIEEAKDADWRERWVRTRMRRRFVFVIEGLHLLKVDLATRGSMIERTLNYHPDILQLMDGSVFFCGGWRQEGTRTRFRSDVWLYDPKTRAVETLLELGEEKAAVVLVEISNNVYAFGGARKGHYLKSANRYLLQSREKEILPHLPTEMKNLTATTHAGKIYLCHMPNLEIEKYDPDTSEYTHILKASARDFTQILLSVQIDNLWALIIGRKSHIVDLDQLTLSPIRVTATSTLKKYASPVHEYRDTLYFLAKNDAASLCVWQLRVSGPATVAMNAVD